MTFSPYSLEYRQQIESMNSSNSLELVDNDETFTSNTSKSKIDIRYIKNSYDGKLNLSLTSVTNATLYISGFCYLTSSTGTVRIDGYTLKAGQKVRLYRPIWQPAMQVEISKPSTNNTQENSVLERRASLVIEEIVSSEQEWMVAAEDQSYYKEDDSREGSFNSIKDVKIGINSALVASFSCMEVLGIDCIRIPTLWKSNLQYLQQSVSKKSIDSNSIKLIVCGAKGVGKSTNIRHCINSLLSQSAIKRVCLIDCDVGQPEFSTPGAISLTTISTPVLSPSYLHEEKPDKSFFIGELTTKNEPTLLITYVKLLLEYYNQLVKEATTPMHKPEKKVVKSKPIRTTNNPFDVLRSLPDEKQTFLSVNEPVEETKEIIPLIVNTDGFIRYIGSELLTSIIEIIQPSNLFFISSEKDKWHPALDTASPSCKIAVLETGKSSPSKVSAADLRTLRLVSYFLRDNEYIRKKVIDSKAIETVVHRVYCNADAGCDVDDERSSLYVQNGNLVDKNGDLALGLLQENSIVVPCESICLEAIGLSVPPNLLPAAFNGALVGLHSESTELRNEASLSFLGLGIVKCIDFNKNNYFLIVPAPIRKQFFVDATGTTRLCRSLLLKKGIGLQLPTALLHSPLLPCFPYLSSEAAGEGAHKMKARNNLKRRSQEL